MQRFALLLAACGIAVASAAPIGPGKPEDTMAIACEECATHKDYLDSKDECVCFASDIMGTFANDATKQKAVNKGAATAKAGGATTENVGAARLAEGWMWHCRPISATEGVWQQC